MKNKINIKIISLIILLGLLFFGISFANGKISFDKKVICSNYQFDIEKKLKSEYMSEIYYGLRLDRIFYSPVLNSCVYSYSFSINSEQDSTQRNFYLVDVLTNKTLYWAYVSNAEFEKKNDYIEIMNLYINKSTKKDELPKHNNTFEFMLRI
jgi:hypothetical protein